jgi:threonylcarbamoyladenosine tRNA methylthiotransferase MtaB
LGADVMVGFPGETDGEFEETLELVRALPFGYLHLFPFSPRPATPGWAMHAERRFQAAVVEERMNGAARSGCGKEPQRTGSSLWAGSWRPSRCTRRKRWRQGGRTAALTENFLPVKIEGQLPANRLVRVRVTALNAEGALKAGGGNASPGRSF